MFTKDELINELEDLVYVLEEGDDPTDDMLSAWMSAALIYNELSSGARIDTVERNAPSDIGVIEDVIATLQKMTITWVPDVDWGNYCEEVARGHLAAVESYAVVERVDPWVDWRGWGDQLLTNTPSIEISGGTYFFED